MQSRDVMVGFETSTGATKKTAGTISAGSRFEVAPGSSVPACLRPQEPAEIVSGLIWLVSTPRQTKWNRTICNCHGAREGSSMAQQRRRVKHTATFEERFAADARKIRGAAQQEAPGSMARELLLRRVGKLRRHLS